MDAGIVRYVYERSEVWSFEAERLTLIAEWTNDHGPLGDDYFYFFIAGDPTEVFEAPMYANPGLLTVLSGAIGAPLAPRLSASTDFKSEVTWPPELEGRPLFKYSPETRPLGVWNRMKDALLPLIRSELTEEVAAFIETKEAVEQADEPDNAQKDQR